MKLIPHNSNVGTPSTQLILSSRLRCRKSWWRWPSERQKILGARSSWPKRMSRTLGGKMYAQRFPAGDVSVSETINEDKPQQKKHGIPDQHLLFFERVPFFFVPNACGIWIVRFLGGFGCNSNGAPPTVRTGRKVWISLRRSSKRP